jgi:hypothetical protein
VLLSTLGVRAEWRSTGIEYAVTLESTASAEALARLAAVVDELAGVPRAIRAGASVDRLREP